ncbi:Nucleolar protein 12 [Arachnomyces sp. PD_36]|nr:Nucleolar protein 12 [Arachnomyces sp. PD_36]
MGQKKHSSSTETAKPAAFLGTGTSVDPLLASLFESSAGPVKAPEIRYEVYKASRDRHAELQNDDAEGLDEDEDMEDVSDEDDEEEATTTKHASNDTAGRKRKRGGAEDDLEASYMRKLAKEEAKEEEKRLAKKDGKRRKVADMDEDQASSSSSPEDENEDSDDDDDINSPPPLHESLSATTDPSALDKSTRTIFLGNVSTEAIKSKSAKKKLLAHLTSFFPSLPESGTPHAIESLRFRSTAFSSAGIPKRASFAKKELMDKTTKSTNAYAVYSTAAAARRAPAALNGTIVLDRHLRVDSVAHPLPVDNKRCIFVGNLGFVDEETHEDDDDKKPKKKPPPSDIEEGLWRVFNSHTGPSPSKSKQTTTGNVESVRVVRDPQTRIGKGFAYVQFHNENHVETALELDGKKFPPLLPRKLRVVRAKRVVKKKSSAAGGPPDRQSKDKGTLQGRATRLFGRAGAAKLRSSTGGAATGANSTPAGERGSARNANGAGAGSGAGASPMVFEGYRATADTPKFKVKGKSRGAGGKGKGKPKTRSSRRGAAFKGRGRQ